MQTGYLNALNDLFVQNSSPPYISSQQFVHRNLYLFCLKLKDFNFNRGNFLQTKH